jgi:hypothetical protein
MTNSKLIFNLIKATSAIAVGLTISFATTGTQPGMAQITPSEDAANSDLIAPNTQAFTPPSNPRRRSGYRTTTGTRQGSCVDDSETAFTILGPSETVGLSSSTRPEFAWYLPPSDTDYPVQFRLLALNAQGIPAPIHTAEIGYTAGFTTYQLPDTATALSPGEEYRWQVVVVCDANYLSRSLNQERSFEVVRPSASLQQSLSAATTEAERALAYGESGFWYDAIAQVARSNNPQSKAIRQTLIEDLASTEVENSLIREDLSKLAEISAQESSENSTTSR